MHNALELARSSGAYTAASPGYGDGLFLPGGFAGDGAAFPTRL